MSKPLVYNYATAEAKIQKQAEEIIRLKEENTNLRIKCRILEADKVTITRCKDCDNTVPHWYMLNGKRVDRNWCVEMESEVDDDEYCSRAVPKGTREKMKGGAK